MTSLLQVYFWTISAGMLLTPALAWLGIHLSSQGRVVDTLTVAQGAAVGTLLGLALSTDHHDSGVHFQPAVLATALIVSGLVFLLTRFLHSRRSPALPALMVGLHFVLMAMGYLIDALLLKVDSHVSLVYFGDLATLVDRDAVLGLSLSTLALVFFVVGYRPLGRLSLESALAFPTSRGRSLGRWVWSFELVALVLLCFGVQFIGVLFTLSAMFLPTALLALAGAAGLRRHVWACILSASLGCGAGFVLSLGPWALPTTPTIVLAITLFSGLAASCLWGSLRRK